MMSTGTTYRAIPSMAFLEVASSCPSTAWLISGAHRERRLSTPHQPKPPRLEPPRPGDRRVRSVYGNLVLSPYLSTFPGSPDPGRVNRDCANASVEASAEDMQRFASGAVIRS